MAPLPTWCVRTQTPLKVFWSPCRQSRLTLTGFSFVQKMQPPASPEWREKVREAITQCGAVAYRDHSGKLLGLFGCNSGSGGPDLPDTFRWASPWLLCDDLPDDLARAVLRASIAWADLLRALAQSGVFVFNVVPKDSPQNRRFIEALGFTIDPNPDPQGRDVFFLKGAAHV